MTTSDLTFQQAYAYLHPRKGGGAKWSLGPTRRLLEEVGNPERRFSSVHIGGTNGKGSVAAMVYQVLRASGRRVGLYTSPHLVDVRERVVVDDRPIGEQAFAAWTGRLRHGIEKTDASFFEATTAIAFADFAARNVEIAIVEVGLGGRLDSTNVLEPLVSAVTNVGMDHTDYLGDNLGDIAREKAGIAKPGVPFVTGEPDEPAAGVLREVATTVGAEVIAVPREASYPGRMRLQGVHQRRNAAVALEIVNRLPPGHVDRGSIEQGLAQAWLPARLDERGRWIFDVAHNLAGMHTLVSALEARRLRRPVHAVLGGLADKDLGGMLHLLSHVVDRTWLTVPPSAPLDRRPNAPHIERLSAKGAVAVPDFDRCLAQAADGAATVVVTGSFHTVGDAMSRLPGFQPFG